MARSLLDRGNAARIFAETAKMLTSMTMFARDRGWDSLHD
jgi:hypothetical protein